MSYQRQSCNGTTIEQIDGKIYINGVETKTGRLKDGYYVFTAVLCTATFCFGYFLGAVRFFA